MLLTRPELSRTSWGETDPVTISLKATFGHSALEHMTPCLAPGTLTR